VVSPGLQFSLFLLKVVTILHPCSPLAVKPWILYPLLLLAAVTLRTSLQVQAFSTLAHILVVVTGIRFGALCAWSRDAAMIF
jgi:hypothetical protein